MHMSMVSWHAFCVIVVPFRQRKFTIFQDAHGKWLALTEITTTNQADGVKARRYFPTYNYLADIMVVNGLFLSWMVVGFLVD